MNNRIITKSPQFKEIWMCNLSSNNGSVQKGYRPVFILSNDKNNNYSTTLNIIPITSNTHKKLPVHVPLQKFNNYGLTKPSQMLVEQITTIPVDCLDRCIGQVNDAGTLNKIRKALSIQLPVLSDAQQII